MAIRGRWRSAASRIVGIEDVTGLVHDVESLVRAGDLEGARSRLPEERPLVVVESVGARLGMAPQPDR